MSSIKDLETSIIHYANLYYSGQPTISDKEFDDLVDNLRNIDPNNVILRTTGWGSSVPEDRKIPHPLINVGGLGKIKCDEDTIITYKSITPKYDGASVELIYENGLLISAITRGNGEYGQNVTDHLVPIVGRHLNYTGIGDTIVEILNSSIVSISGEFILSNESFRTNYPDEISYRNIPSGFLNRKSVEESECKKFSFIPYRINAVVTNADHVNDCRVLFNDRLGVQSVLNSIFSVQVPFIINEDPAKYSDIMKVFKSLHDYEFDGLVINKSGYITSVVEDYNNDKYLIKFKYDEIAYKTVTETADVVINNISWSLTRTGRYVPVAEFDDVELSGAMIHRATLHNAKNVFDNKIGVGATIRITRSGEIIPFLLEVLNPVEVSNDFYCPICGEKLVLDGADLVCNNPHCEAKEYQRVYQWITYLGEVDGAGGSLYNDMLEFGDIKHISDFYEKDINWSNMIHRDGMGESKLKLVYEIINKLHQSMEFYWILVASNIKGISSSNAKKLQNNTNLKECIENNTPELFSVDNAKGLGWSVKNSILTNWDILMHNFSFVKLKDSIEEIPNEDNLTKLKICVTGKLSCGTRSVFFNKYQDKVIETDIKNCDYLLTNNPNSGSSKNKEAIKLGKSVIGEEEFCKLIGVSQL